MKLRLTITALIFSLVYGSASVAEFAKATDDDPTYTERDSSIKEIDESYGSIDNYAKYTGDDPHYLRLNVGDLVVWFIGQAPSCLGGNLAVDYRIQNMLGDPVNETFKVLVTVNGQIHPDPVNNPHEVTGPLYGGLHVHLSNISPGPGMYYIEVEADYEHVAWEVDNNNNKVGQWVECLE